MAGTPDKVMDKSDMASNSHSNNSAINSKPTGDFLKLREVNKVSNLTRRSPVAS